jgi:hypothetical protein
LKKKFVWLHLIEKAHCLDNKCSLYVDFITSADYVVVDAAAAALVDHISAYTVTIIQ